MNLLADALQHELDAAGAETKIVSFQEGTIRGWAEYNWGDAVAVDLIVDQAKEEDSTRFFYRRGNESRPPAHESESRRVCTTSSMPTNL